MRSPWGSIPLLHFCAGGGGVLNSINPFGMGQNHQSKENSEQGESAIGLLTKIRECGEKGRKILKIEIFTGMIGLQ
jgi:hypothetical protein